MRIAALLLLVAGCSGDGFVASPPGGGADLGGLALERISINGIEFEVWLAETRAERETGLMFATDEQLAPLTDGTERGMLFVFPGSFFLSFWMRDTFVPLDLAYIRSDGTIAEIHALTPLDETNVISAVPVQFALEVRQGVLAALGIGVGDLVVLPPKVFD